MSEEVVVAGAGFYGVSTALELDGRGFDVTLIDQKGYQEYTPGLIDLIRERVKQSKLKLELADFFDRTDVDFSREKIIRMEPDKELVETNSGTHSYDYLVLALGGQVRDFGVDTSSLEKCYSFKQAKDMTEKAEDVEEAVVVGAGYVGLEIAGELQQKGLDVTVVDAATQPSPKSNEATSEKALDYMNKKEIAFRGGKRVVDAEEDMIEFENGDIIETDMVVWSTGVKASEVVTESFDTDPAGLKVNSGLSAENYSDVFAGGDCADHDYIKTAHNAMRMAETTAENIEKSEKESLKQFAPGFDPLVISLGNTAIFEYGDRSFKSRLFRYFKDLVRKYYWSSVHLKRIKNAI